MISLMLYLVFSPDIYGLVPLRAGEADVIWRGERNEEQNEAMLCPWMDTSETFATTEWMPTKSETMNTPPKNI